VSAWGAVLGGAAACYLLKLAGLSVPAAVLDRPRVRAVADRLPVALLAGLVAVQVFGGDQRVLLDARAAGLLAALVLLLARAPFLVVVIGSAVTAAVLRQLGLMT
jgi:branched-subunit amino acid transport protein